MVAMGMLSFAKPRLLASEVSARANTTGIAGAGKAAMPTPTIVGLKASATGRASKADHNAHQNDHGVFGCLRSMVRTNQIAPAIEANHRTVASAKIMVGSFSRTGFGNQPGADLDVPRSGRMKLVPSLSRVGRRNKSWVHLKIS